MSRAAGAAKSELVLGLAAGSHRALMAQACLTLVLGSFRLGGAAVDCYRTRDLDAFFPQFYAVATLWLLLTIALTTLTRIEITQKGLRVRTLLGKKTIEWRRIHAVSPPWLSIGPRARVVTLRMDLPFEPTLLDLMVHKPRYIWLYAPTSELDRVHALHARAWHVERSDRTIAGAPLVGR